MSEAAALRGFRIVYVAYIVYASIKTLVQATHALHGASSPAYPHVFLAGLASLEIVAALLFLVARFEMAACAGLLAIYGVAAVVTLAEGGIPAHLIYYAATALFIVFVQRRGSARNSGIPGTGIPGTQYLIHSLNSGDTIPNSLAPASSPSRSSSARAPSPHSASPTPAIKFGVRVEFPAVNVCRL